jgi:hypothetical protein
MVTELTRDLGMGATVDMVKQKWAAVEMAEKRCRQQMRLIAPVVDEMPQLYPMVHSMDQYFAIKHCTICNPPPEVFRCPICDFETEERWQMQNHRMGGQSLFCKKRQKAKEKAWASKVGLDG